MIISELNRIYRTFVFSSFLLAMYPNVYPTSLEQPIIIDHTCTDINKIPQKWILEARIEYRIAYTHASHGKQIIRGLHVLDNRNDLFIWNHDGTAGALSLHDYHGQYTLAVPNRVEWNHITRELLDDPNNDRNLIMWAWSYQMWPSSENDIKTYLDLMNLLEIDYPDVTFIYMTGPLAGTGEEGNLHKRNNQIREFCKNHNKVLFDFADIESYDPDGSYFLDKYADEECNYDSDNDGIVDSNWAEEWLALNPESELAIQSSQCAACPHSDRLNCILKGRAFWWMMARLSGWEECDYNQDGYIDNYDLNDKQATILQEYDKWVRKCWDKNKQCADINKDGVIDRADKHEKYFSLMRDLAAWEKDCELKRQRTRRR